MLPLPVAYKIHPMTRFRSLRPLCRAAFLLLFLALPAAKAQKSAGFRLISWSPERLESGSPVLFRVEADQHAESLHGSWLDHPLLFTRAHQGNTWYALATHNLTHWGFKRRNKVCGMRFRHRDAFYKT